MSDSIINIILNTVKKGNGDKEALNGVKKLSAGFKELTGFNLGHQPGSLRARAYSTVFNLSTAWEYLNW